jgi:restriction system protein
MDEKIQWTINLIEKLKNEGIGEKTRLNSIKSILEIGDSVLENDKKYLKEKLLDFNKKLIPSKSENHSTEKVKNIETVFLDTLDGFEFESFCQRLFELSGWGVVEQIGGVADGGRDLIIHPHNASKIIVECKHQPNTSIGRPIVQKLHSAIISSNTNQGIIVTTGKFSKQAIEYAEDLNSVTIRLFDMSKIVELAQKAGIQIANAREDFQIYTFPLRNNIQLQNQFHSKLPAVQSYPGKITDFLEISIEETSLVSMYEAIVDLYQSFDTSAGHIHSIDINSKAFHFHGESGTPIRVSYPTFIPVSNNLILFKKQDIDASVMVKPFNLERTTLSEKIKNTVVDEQTTNVGYYGRNNVHYVKQCVPSKRNVRINNVNQILIPRYKLQLKILMKQYSMILMESERQINIPETNFFTCKICNQKINNGSSLLLCNSCGNICHPADMNNAHSYLCEICNKTICQNCTYYTRKYLFMKKKLCQTCAEKTPNKMKKLVTI